MNDSERLEFITRAQTAVLATQWTGGRVHAVPVWYLFEDGVFKIITERGSQKHRNAVRSGRATICLDEADGRIRYVVAEGPVRVVDPVGYEQRLALHRHYRGEESARSIVDKGGHEKMVILELTPEHWLGWEA